MPRRKAANHIQKSRIVARLKELDKTQRQLAAHLGIHPPGVTELLKGARGLSADEAERAGEFLGWPREEVYLAFGISALEKSYGRLTVWGYIDANSGRILVRADVDPPLLEYIDAPFPGYRGSCLKIKGNSMAPRYRDGEVIGFTKGEHDFARLVNQEVVAATVDGRLLLKVLHPGNGAGVYTLSSLNPEDEPILNVELDWVAPIDWHMPRRT